MELFSFISSLFKGRNRSKRPPCQTKSPAASIPQPPPPRVTPLHEEHKPAEIFLGLRQQVLTLDSSKVTHPENMRVWGVLMETGYPGAIATLVALADSTVSLYLSNGGGMIGMGQHEGPARVCVELLATAPAFLADTYATTTFPLARLGTTRFFFLTTDGIRTFEAKEDDLGNGRSSLSPLFHKAHELIHEVTLVHQRQTGSRE